MNTAHYLDTLVEQSQNVKPKLSYLPISNNEWKEINKYSAQFVNAYTDDLWEYNFYVILFLMAEEGIL